MVSTPEAMERPEEVEAQVPLAMAEMPFPGMCPPAASSASWMPSYRNPMYCEMRF